jgi:heat shock protein HslJ
VIVLFTAFLAGCFPPANLPQGGKNAMSPKSIEGSEWQLVTVGAASAVAGSAATMRFSDGRVAGTTGCNRYTGPYTSEAAGAIEFGPLASTMMACPEPQIRQEQAFLQALDAAATYVISGGILTLKAANGDELATFAPRESATLVGTPWSATGINNGKNAVVSLAAGSEVTAVFAGDGRLSGNAGCNKYSAAYEVDGNKISIKAPISTKMACPDPKVLEQETAYLIAVTKATTYRMDGDKLELRDDEGALQVGFRARR